jgi:hypothetical protein
MDNSVYMGVLKDEQDRQNAVGKPAKDKFNIHMLAMDLFKVSIGATVWIIIVAIVLGFFPSVR